MRFHLYHGPACDDLQYLSSGFWVVLEKHGFLDISDGRLGELPPDRQGTCAVVTASAAQDLTDEDLSDLRRVHPLVVVEGPWGDASLTSIGRCGDVVAEGGGVKVRRTHLLEALDHWLGGGRTPSYSGAWQGPESLVMAPRTLRDRRQSDVVDPLQAELAAWAPLNPWRIHAADLPSDADVVAEVAGQPLLAELPGLVILPQPLLSYLTEDHTAPVLEHTYTFSQDRFALELLLLRVMTGAWHRLGRPVVRIAPWPASRGFAFTIRHDVDRVPSPEDMQRLLDAEARHGAGVSAYFQSKTARPDVVERFAENGAEIAWHVAQLLPDGPEELAQITGLGHEVRGVTVHGNAGNYGWRGLPNWRHAEEQGLSYVENLSSARYLPSRTLDFEGGHARGRDLLSLPHHHSLDKGMRDTYLVELLEALPTLARVESHVIVLNHPDINIPDVEALLEAVPDGAWHATASDVADWWRRSHYRDNLRLAVEGGDESVDVTVESRDDVLDDLVVEIAGFVPDVSPARTTQSTSPVVDGATTRVALPAGVARSTVSLLR